MPGDRLPAEVAVVFSLPAALATLRATRYGNVLSPDTAATYATVAAHVPVNDVKLHANTPVDLEGRFAFNSRVNLAFGAETSRQ